MASKAFRTWAIIRRIQYGVGFLFFWGLLGTLIFFVNFHQPANCFDLSLNGDETGVDCGGACVRICEADVLPPRVVWAESFEIKNGQYNTVAYVENPNQTAATPALKYTFELLNNGIVVASRSGTTVLPPNSVYPIFEGRIQTDSNESVTDTNLIIEEADLWIPASIGRDQFKSVDINLTGADTKPVLKVVVENTELQSAENIEVVATVFNEVGTPVTASQTFIEHIEARSTKNIVFTWPNSIAKTVRSCIIPTDVVVAVDLSGSMNNDGGDPPQPVTDALKAAGKFINSLKENDQVSVVTFATRAAVVTELNSIHGAVANAVTALEIDLVEETGYTNTVEALLVAQDELNSERHNVDARRVLVLLTDGLPTASGDKDVVTLAEAAAAALSADNIEVYAIGLGQNVDSKFINKIASKQKNAYFAPTGADLSTIYSEITSSLCESGPTKIDVIAKTKTNFAPLR
ncbi:MAG: VWA domain-containing protein [Candidatus Pacebacteria bacterium]|nr:VWA domain-containing protein [Candidatus Paceibacterota bacterium]